MEGVWHNQSKMAIESGEMAAPVENLEVARLKIMRVLGGGI
jgi:hypothetical protein